MYRPQRNASAGAEQQYQFSASSSNFNYSPYSSTVSGIIADSAFHNSPQHLSPRSVMARQRSHDRRSSTDSQHMMKPPNGSPRFGSQTPVQGNSPSFTPTDRSLPPKEVTEETIADAYVAFILYCNPNFALDVDSSTLRTNFQNPPKSDSKDFEVYRLYELIQKLDSKEIKTWAQLALDLGVEAPDLSKGQSTQKVQQYSVRLKRWMRAMHVDAFFEYLLGKQHTYFTEIPHPSDPHPLNGRDGVSAEEDLAIRALDPAFRPKRGRKQYDAESASANKHPKLMEGPRQGAPSSANPASSLIALSANADRLNDPWAVASAVTPQTFAPWANKSPAPQSAIVSTPSHFRWQLDENSQNIVSPHPMTAHPSSMAAHIEAAFDNEPRSAITPSTRKRRKHGPAVSSAWPSVISAGAKPRGRPPANRSAQDGPFRTFPADPVNEKTNGPHLNPPDASSETNPTREEQAAISARPPIIGRQSDGSGRLGRLSLQVPPHTGGPVRLATPPTVLVNGRTNGGDGDASNTPMIESPQQIGYPPPERLRVAQSGEGDLPGFAYEALKRVLASDLLRAELTGRRHRLNGDEAKRLAGAVLERFNIPQSDTDNARDNITRLTAASWLGVGDQLNVPLGPAVGQNKRISITRFRLDADGYEEIVSAYEDGPGYHRELFDLSWTVTMGGCNGTFELQGLSLGEPEPEKADMADFIIDTFIQAAKHSGLEERGIDRVRQKIANSNPLRKAGDVAGDDKIDWEARFQQLEFGAKLAKGETNRFKHRVIERLLDALLEC